MVVDISISIRPPQLIEEAQAVKKIMKKFDIGPGKARVGIIKYHNYSITEYNLSDFESHQELEKAKIVQRPKKVAGTRTDRGLAMMQENFKSESAAGRKQVAIVITDGKATKPKSLNEAVAKLHKTNILVKHY